MSVNPLNDISKVYLEQVASIDEARSIEHMRDRYLKDPKEIAKSRAKNITDRKKKRAALAHMEKQYAGMKAGIYSSYEPDGEMVDEAKKEKPKRWWDDDGDGIGYEKGEVSGKFKKKKVKEGFSNWRQDLSEVIGDIETETETERQIKEKDNIKNIVIINPKLGEAVEEIGGTLLEMVEIEDTELIEKAESEQQQKLFGLALSVKRGQTPRSEASPEVLKIVDSMSEKKIRDFAKTKHEGIPKKVEEELQPTTPQQFAAQRQLAMAQKKLTAADQIALQKKKKDMQQAQEEFVSEEDYDTKKDSHLERGGMGARSSTSPAKSGSSKPETPEERKERMEKQRKTAQKALELVRQKYKGSLM